MEGLSKGFQSKWRVFSCVDFSEWKKYSWNPISICIYGGVYWKAINCLFIEELEKVGVLARVNKAISAKHDSRFSKVKQENTHLLMWY